jgi:glycerol-3-phosphate cytidylyltransferase-like family protein
MYKDYPEIRRLQWSCASVLAAGCHPLFHYKHGDELLKGKNFGQQFTNA